MGGQPQASSFSIGITSDEEHVFITLGIPRSINLPLVGPTSLKTIGLAIATAFVPLLLWYGRRTVRRRQQYLKDKKEEREEEEQDEEEALRKPESPVKATKWESNSHKLDEFMSNEVLPARQRLRKVEDPDTVAKRMAKRERIKEEQAKKPKGKLGLSEDLLQNVRSGLRQNADAPLAAYLEEKKKNYQSLDDII